MKIVFQGPMWDGSTSLQRFEAMRRVPGVTVIPHDVQLAMDRRISLWTRIRWRLRWPVDESGENAGLVAAVAEHRPDAVIVEGSKVVTRATLRKMRALGVRALAYYTPDDIMGAHNLSWPLRLSFPEWDVFFTTKTFNVPELRAAGVRNPILVGKSFDAALHRPIAPAEIGDDYERFDLVFIGACEGERLSSLNALAAAGLSVVVYGGALGNWPAETIHPSITLREAVFGEAYTRALHHGKVALGFLRKLNRDRITQRTMEITACARPMLAEKTDEHDEHFRDGEEYVGFTSDDDLVAKARRLLADAELRRSIAARGRARCLSGGYSTDDRARQMLDAVRAVLAPAGARDIDAREVNERE